MLITSSKYHEQVKHLYWQFNIISTSKYFLLKYGASAGNKTDKKIIKKSGENMFWWLTNESNPSHFDIFVKCYEIFLYIYAACCFGGGGGLTKKNPTIFQKLNQVNSNMATPSTFQQDFVFLYSLNSTGL